MVKVKGKGFVGIGNVSRRVRCEGGRGFQRKMSVEGVVGLCFRAEVR